MRLLSSALLLSFLLFAPCGQALAQEKRVADFTQLEKVVLEELKATGTPGAVIAVVSGDRVVFAKAFGVANVETNEPVTTGMLFRIASVTKMFTATAIVSRVAQGKMKLDEPIGAYVKELNPQLSGVTLHQLLTHTGGLVNEVRREGPLDDSAFAASVRLWKDENLFFEQAGQVYSYSNPGFVLAGLTLQESGNQPYPEMMSELLFKPLGMKRTTFQLKQAVTYPLAMGHAIGADKKPVLVRPYPGPEYLPAGGMISNVEDLSRFCIALMNNGRLDGQQALSPAIINKLSTPYVTAYNASGEWKQGYGMRIGDDRGVRVIEHLGGTTGFGSQIRMAPEHRFAVIILANSSLAQLSRTTEKAMELLLPLRAKTESKPVSAQPLNAADLLNFAGTFRNGPFKFRIFSRENRLFLRVGEDEVPLKKTGERLFSIDEREEDATPESALFRNLLLLPGADGKAEYLYFAGRALKRVPDDK